MQGNGNNAWQGENKVKNRSGKKNKTASSKAELSLKVKAERCSGVVGGNSPRTWTVGEDYEAFCS